jgi:hypothetical protein
MSTLLQIEKTAIKMKAADEQLQCVTPIFMMVGEAPLHDR